MASPSSGVSSMPRMDNAAIARVLEEVADVLEIRNENPFRIRAYRNAVRTIQVQTTPLARMLAEGKPLTGLPGIGKRWRTTSARWWRPERSATGMS